MMNMAIPSNYNTRPVQQSPTNHTPPKTPQGTKSQNIKNAATPKKDTKNPWLLWGSALAGTALVGAGIALCVKDNQARLSTIKAIPELLESIFGKKYTPNEATTAVKKYRELLQITDRDDFITQAFHYIKQEFGLQEVELKLHITDKGFFNRQGGVASLFGDEVSIDKHSHWLDSQRTRIYLLKSITHKLKHIEQCSLIDRAGIRKQAFIQSLVNSKDLFEKFPWLDVNNPQHMEVISANFDSPFQSLEKIPIHKGTPEFERAQKLWEASLIYSTKRNYRSNLLEVEAFHVGDEMTRFVQQIINNRP
jgi:hypothetical protein